MPSLQTLLFDLIILGIFGLAIYAFLIQPRRREFRKRVAYVSTVKPGARVTTYGGIIGTVKSIDYEAGTARVEIAEGVVVEMLSASIMGDFDRDAVAESTQKAID